jgi:hypothetical protein
VYLSTDEGHIQRNTFTYGEEFDMNFNNISGFIKSGEAVFPGLSLQVQNKDGIVVMETEDLYANYTEGMDFSPLLLVASLTVATPIQSADNYLLTVMVWDKKGKGTFTAKMPFDVTPDDRIEVDMNKTTCDEVYLYSGNSGMVITSHEVTFDEEVYLIFEGLTGFAEEGDKVFVGMSVNATDNAGHTILEHDDLFESYSESGIGISELKDQVFANITFTRGAVSNPVSCTVTIYDKQGDASITARTDLTVR